MLTEGEELFGCTRVISYRKLTMTQPQGDTVLFWLGPALLGQCCNWPSGFRTHLVRCLQRQRPQIEHWHKMVENVNRSKEKKWRRRRSNSLNAEHVLLDGSIVHILLDSQLWTLEPQLAFLICLHCLKSTFSVFKVTPIFSNCTVVVAAYLRGQSHNDCFRHTNQRADLLSILLIISPKSIEILYWKMCFKPNKFPEQNINSRPLFHVNHSWSPSSLLPGFFT